MSSKNNPQPLNIAIIGAGIGGLPAAIGGLPAAIGLRRAGHNVSMYEKSRFKNEVGAAIVLPPNIDSLLKRLGVDPESYGANLEEGTTLYSPEGKVRLETKIGRPEHAARLIHRVDLHEALRNGAVTSCVKIHLGSVVESIHIDAGVIGFADGTNISADVIVGADGVHSVARNAVLSTTELPCPVGVSMFRILIPIATVAAVPTLKQRFVPRTGQMSMWDDRGGRRIVTYPCRNNTMLNIGALFSECIASPSPEDPELKQNMLQIFKGFHEDILNLLSLADDVLLWQLLDLPAITHWSAGHVALMGDAAHPLLPHAAQGAAQALEDAVTLVVMLPLGTLSSEVPERLGLYCEARKHRADWIQEFSRSSARSTPGNTVLPNMSMEDFFKRAFQHDAWAHAEETLATSALRQSTGSL